MSQTPSDREPTQAALTASRAMALLLYAATLFLSASLMFAIEPMFAKIALPLLGGSPEVWNTAIVFFQATLLLGYGYAHLSVRLLGLRRPATLHLAVIALTFATLPIGAVSWTPPVEGSPVLWLIGFLTASIDLVFFVVSATAPLLQRWFAHTDHPAAHDPYFLYGASNLGSITALLGYPLLLERPQHAAFGSFMCPLKDARKLDIQSFATMPQRPPRYLDTLLELGTRTAASKFGSVHWK